MRTRFPQINATVLAVFLLVSLPVLAGGVLLVLLAGQATLRDTYGQHLAQLAQQTAASVDEYVYRKVLDVSMLGRAPNVREAVMAAPSTSASGLASSSASRYFADLVSHDPVYREILVTNREGAIVAASGPMDPANLSGEDWWTATMDDGGSGRVFVSELRRDPNEGISVMQVSAPIPEDDSERLLGVVRVIFDARELMARVGGLQLGATGMATIVRENGTVVFSRVSTDSSSRFFASRELSDSLAQMSNASGLREDSLHFSATAADGDAYVVGVGRSQLSRSFPNLAWVVAVSQAESEMISSVGSIGWYLLLVFVLTIVLVLVLALYFSMRLHAPPIDVDMGLVEHPHVSRMPDTGDEDDELPDARPTK